MAAFQLRTFKDIVDQICETLKIQSSDTVSRARIKRNVNTIYLSEVVPYKTWKWSRGQRTLQTEPYTSAGTANVQQNLVEVTLSQAPNTSKKGYWFSAVDDGAAYKIASHTAGSVDVILENPYSGATAVTAGYRIWTDAIPLPSDCKETLEVTPQYGSAGLNPYGLQEFRRMAATGFRREGTPVAYTTTDYRDPEVYGEIPGLPQPVSRQSTGLIKRITYNQNMSAFLQPGAEIEVRGAGQYTYNIEAIVSNIDGTDVYYTGTVPFQEGDTADTAVVIRKRNTESYNAYRELLIYPALSDRRTTLLVDYQKHIGPLENDSDEPAMPIEDRSVLFYGGMWLSCNRERNPEWAAENKQLFDIKLAKMAGKTEDSPDKPELTPSLLYVKNKKKNRSNYGGFGGGWGDAGGGWGGAGGSAVTGVPSTVAVFDASGNLISSPSVDVSELALLNGALTGSAVIPPSSVNAVVASFPASSFPSSFFMMAVTRGTDHATKLFLISSIGSGITTCTAVGTSGSPVGVTFDSAINGGNIQILATTDAVGADAEISYKAILLQ